jgi:hypothetical protein
MQNQMKAQMRDQIKADIKNKMKAEMKNKMTTMLGFIVISPRHIHGRGQKLPENWWRNRIVVEIESETQ